MIISGILLNVLARNEVGSGLSSRQVRSFLPSS